jgi:hypothetical protein
LFISGICSAQKYVLIDKKMSVPVSYTDKVTMRDDYKELFAVEKKSITQFLKEIENISKQLVDKKKAKPESFDYKIGITHFHGLKVPLSIEERIDVVLTSDCGDIKTSIHLADAKSSNANNAFFIKTWLKYIRSYVK